jgi:endonuclease-3 related protein
MKTISLMKLYKKLYSRYGAQGWWPIATLKHTFGFDERGYHPGDYSYPATASQLFEIVAGAVLTQNTAWKNVEKAIYSLKALKLLDPVTIVHSNQEEIARAIHSSGYHNQKAKKLKIITRFLTDNGFLRNKRSPERDELLALWGIGPETADSILLYGYKKPVFVIDTYTCRLLFRLGFTPEKAPYQDLQRFFQDRIKPSTEMYNEFHALIVQHAKVHCAKKPACTNCPLLDDCVFGQIASGI